MKTLGTAVMAARSKMDLTRKQLAKKLGISEAYVAFIERDRPIWLSERLVAALKKVLGVGITGPMIEKANKRATKYREQYK